MIVGLSFDIAPTHSAYIIWYEDRYLDRETFKKAKCPTVEMSRWIVDKIRTLDALEGIEWIAVEKSIYIQNARNTINLGKLLGAMEHICDQLSIQYYEGTTAEIDSACGIPHKDRKTYTESLATNYFQLEDSPTEDECDAIAIGVWGWGKFKEYQILQNGLDMSE